MGFTRCSVNCIDKIRWMRFFQQLAVLYGALLLGQLLFFGVVYFLMANNMVDNQSMDDSLFRIIVPIMILGAAGAAYALDRQRQGNMDKLQDLEAKTQHYRNAVILRCALIEGANFFALLAGLLTQNYTYLLYFAVGLLAFIYFRPSKQQFIDQYELSAREREEMD